MEKDTHTMGFWSKLLGEKKSECCGVVVEEVESERQTPNSAGSQESKCCAEKTNTASTREDS